MLVKVQNIWLNPVYVVSVDGSEIEGVTRIVVAEGGEQRVEYRTGLTPDTVVRRLNQLPKGSAKRRRG